LEKLILSLVEMYYAFIVEFHHSHEGNGVAGYISLWFERGHISSFEIRAKSAYTRVLWLLGDCFFEERRDDHYDHSATCYQPLFIAELNKVFKF